MNLWNSVLDFLLPRYCKVCGRRLAAGEVHMCVPCFLGMPCLDYDMNGLSPAEKILMTERQVVRAASMMQYDKDSHYRNLLYNMKYYNKPKVGTWLAGIGARRLQSKGFFEGVDCIVPVPLSKRKQRRRGYNQCSFIARGVSGVIGLPVVENAVVRDVEKVRQAGLGKYQRWDNAEGLFRVAEPGVLAGRHILLVDDVMTTGSTLCSMIETIAAAVPDIKISVFTLGIVEV